MMYFRWISKWEQWRPEIEALTSDTIPTPLRKFLPFVFQRTISKQLKAHGMGRRPESEIVAYGRADLQVVNKMLGDKDFLLGDQFSLVDATAFACLANFLYSPLDTPFRTYIQQSPGLIKYCERIK